MKKTPIEDLRRESLRHYEKASSAIHHWDSFVANAIKNYDPEAKRFLVFGFEITIII